MTIARRGKGGKGNERERERGRNDALGMTSVGAPIDDEKEERREGWLEAISVSALWSGGAEEARQWVCRKGST